MICPDCRKGAELMQAGDKLAADVQHAQCPGGTWCACKHVTDRSVLRKTY